MPQDVSTDAPDDPADLTRYIESRYHARHREQLPKLASIAATIEAVHAGHDKVPAGLAEIFRRLIGEMEVHMKKEELMVFPQIRKGGSPGLAALLVMMRADHDDQDSEAVEIRRLTDGLTLPEDACSSWATLYAETDQFLTDLAEHFRLENDVLFPQFERKE